MLCPSKSFKRLSCHLKGALNDDDQEKLDEEDIKSNDMNDFATPRMKPFSSYSELQCTNSKVMIPVQKTYSDQIEEDSNIMKVNNISNKPKAQG